MRHIALNRHVWNSFHVNPETTIKIAPIFFFGYSCPAWLPKCISTVQKIMGNGHLMDHTPLWILAAFHLSHIFKRGHGKNISLEKYIIIWWYIMQGIFLVFLISFSSCVKIKDSIWLFCMASWDPWTSSDCSRAHKWHHSGTTFIWLHWAIKTELEVWYREDTTLGLNHSY